MSKYKPKNPDRPTRRKVMLAVLRDHPEGLPSNMLVEMVGRVIFSGTDTLISCMQTLRREGLIESSGVKKCECCGSVLTRYKLK